MNLKFFQKNWTKSYSLFNLLLVFAVFFIVQPLVHGIASINDEQKLFEFFTANAQNVTDIKTF